MAAETRGDEQERSVPIGEYALVSDRQGAALVSRAGSIDWACLPRFDSPAIFARLVDRAGGHWRVAPRRPRPGAAGVPRGHHGAPHRLPYGWGFRGGDRRHSVRPR
jgi:Domain of unknown function (DUF5911)